MITLLMHSLMNILVVLLLTIKPIDAYFVSISDKAYPFITDVDSGLPLAWSYGSYAQLTRSSVALRVNERGVNFIHSGKIRDVLSSSQWDVYDCYDSTTSLCVLKDGSRVFPFDKVWIASNRSAIDSEIKSVALKGCQTTRNANRMINDRLQLYDISLCDVVDSRLDVLYLNMQNKLLMRRNNTYLWIYVLVSIVSVYLVSNIAQNVSLILPGHNAKKIDEYMHKSVYFWISEIAIIFTALVTILYPCIWDMALVTDIEFGYCVFGLFYLLLHTCYYFHRVLKGQEKENLLSFNLITGTLLLLTQGVYNTIANPYSGVLLIMLSLRCFYKLFKYYKDEDNGYDTESILHAIFMVLDIVLLVLTYYIGLRPTFLYRFSSDVSFVLIILFSWVVCSFIVE